MQYCEPTYFLLFLPLVVLLYHFTPQKKRWIILLIASYLFFISLSRFLLVYLLIATLWIYVLARLIEKVHVKCKSEVKQYERSERKAIKKKYQSVQRRYVGLGVVGLIGLLVVLKYSDFIGTNINVLLEVFNTSIPVYRFMVPIGISFYSLQGVSYLVDVYREKIQADHHLGRLALYMSYFPQLMEGPICRYDQTAMALFEGKDLTSMNMRFGMQRILYGLIKKIVIADRLNPIISTVFKDYQQYDGGMMALAMICYTCQLYMEFSGTIDVVLGSSQIFGVALPENFKQPFFSKSISDFWARWHITLGTWFKDYIYYPMSLSSPLKKLTKWGRKAIGHYYGPLLAGTIALFCVWFCNGVWHGDAWNYIFFGMYHFMLIFLANIFAPLVSKFYEVTHISKDWFWVKGIRILKTVLFVCVGELFFRAHGLKAGLDMFIKMITDFTWVSFENLSFLKLGVDSRDFMIVIMTCVIVFIVSLCRERHISICLSIESKPIVIRWAIWYGLIFYLIIFGAYGVGYIPVDPIYAGF